MESRDEHIRHLIRHARQENARLQAEADKIMGRAIEMGTQRMERKMEKMGWKKQMKERKKWAKDEGNRIANEVVTRYLKIKREEEEERKKRDERKAKKKKRKQEERRKEGRVEVEEEEEEEWIDVEDAE